MPRWLSKGLGAFCAGGLLAWAALAGQASAEEPASGSAETTAAAPTGPAPAESGDVRLDQLLTLPASRTYSVERKGGLTRGEWRTRYAEARADLQKERDALAATEAKLEGVGGGQWKVNPIPGADTTDSPDAPIDFQLRSSLRRHREEVERIERKLRQLDIEANLAGVPSDWRS